jgi:hypothetical protein
MYVEYVRASLTFIKESIMGYSTSFEGSFRINRPLEYHHRKYLTMLSSTMRVVRDPKVLLAMRQKGEGNQQCFELLEKMGMGFGKGGEFYCGTGYGGLPEGDESAVVTDLLITFNQPSSWLQWAPNAAGTEISWDGRDKFENYVEWLQYIVSHFLAPWGYTIRGEVKWTSSKDGTSGVIKVHYNDIKVIKKGEVVVMGENTSRIINKVREIRDKCIRDKKGSVAAAHMLDTVLEEYARAG